MTDLKSLAASFLALLPNHAAGLTIDHNSHKGSYMSVEDHLNFRQADDADIHPDDRSKAIELDELWECQWYPNTPVGFCWIAAPTFERLIERLAEEGNDA